MTSIICQHKSNSAVRAAGVGSTFLISDSDREIKCCVSWEVLYTDKIDKLSFRHLVCGDWRTPAKNYNAFIVFLDPMILARRTLTPNCAKKYGLKFTSSKLPETEPVKELKKTVCRNLWRLFERMAQYKFQLAETFRTVRERNLEHLSTPDFMATDCFLKSLVSLVQNRHFSVCVENERSTYLPVCYECYTSFPERLRTDYLSEKIRRTWQLRKEILRRGWRGKKVLFPFILIPSVHTQKQESAHFLKLVWPILV